MGSISLSEYLRGTINDYLKKKSHSLITLSDKSGIHYNTLARILKGRVESPSLETTLGILKVCGADRTDFERLRNFFPDYDVILDIMQTEQDQGRDIFSEVHQLLEDEISFRILLLARTKSGVSLREIQNLFGNFGRDRLQLLIDRQWVEFDGHQVRAHGRPMGMDLKLNRDFLRALCSLVDNDEGRERSQHWNIVEKLNDEGLLAVRKASLDFITEIESIRTNARYQGDETAFVGFLSGVLDSDALNESSSIH